MIRARFYLGSRALTGPAHLDHMAVGWTVTLRRICEAARIAYDHGITGATVIPAVGLWEGDLEPSLVIETLGEYTETHVRCVAEALREAHAQDTVLWTIEPIHSGSANRPQPKGTSRA